MLSKIIKEKIELKFGQTIRYAKDCEVLANDIYKHTNQNISGSTIKRLFGLIKGIQEPRLYTMDLIANYLGYSTYEELINEFDTNTDNHSAFESLGELSSINLAIGTSIKFGYEPCRELIIQYRGDSVFQVLSSQNSKLKKHDIIRLSQIVLHYPLFISEVIRENKSLGQYTAGKISGITFIEELVK
jgi:hypothetical protein